MIVERIIFWWRVKNKQRRIVKEVLSLYRSDRFAAINKLKKNAQLPIARIFLEAMELEQPTPDEFRLALDSAVQAEIPILRKDEFRVVKSRKISMYKFFLAYEFSQDDIHINLNIKSKYEKTEYQE